MQTAAGGGQAWVVAAAAPAAAVAPAGSSSCCSHQALHEVKQEKADVGEQLADKGELYS